MLLLFSKRKRLLLDESNEVLCTKVKQVEEFLNEPMDIWSDEEEYERVLEEREAEKQAALKVLEA